MTRPGSTSLTSRRPHTPWLAGGFAGTALLLAACSGAGAAAGATSPPAAPNSRSWSSVLAEAKGQTVNWYMYGGDDVLNTFVTGYVADALGKQGVTLNQVKITSTGDAVNKVLGEKQAGRSTGGSVDAIWVNGENFATGVQANLWYCGWDKDLPNSSYVDFANPAVANDFGVPVKGCESAWQQANSALVYDSAKLTSADVASVSSLIGWAKAHPGHFTYPALPDFTGSMAVRTILYDTVGGATPLAGAVDEGKYGPAATKLWTRLNDLEPALWRGGSTYPQSQAAVEKLFSDGEISAFFTYGPGAVGEKVRTGLYPASTREAVPTPGNIANTSFLSIPDNAAHKAAALVLANTLQDPQTQLALFTAEGIFPGIDVSKTDAATQGKFATVPLSPSVLPLTALTRSSLPELSSAYVTRIETDWRTNVLQR